MVRLFLSAVNFAWSTMGWGVLPSWCADLTVVGEQGREKLVWARVVRESKIVIHSVNINWAGTMYQVLCWTTPTLAHPKWKNKIESENTNAKGEERASWGRKLRGLRSLRWWGLSLRPSFWPPHFNPPPLLVLLVFRGEVVPVAVSLSELHLMHSLTYVPVEEGLPEEHGSELLWDVLKSFWMVVLLPVKVTTILRPWGGMLQMAILTLLGIHSKE